MTFEKQRTLISLYKTKRKKEKKEKFCSSTWAVSSDCEVLFLTVFFFHLNSSLIFVTLKRCVDSGTDNNFHI